MVAISDMFLAEQLGIDWQTGLCGSCNYSRNLSHTVLSGHLLVFGTRGNSKWLKRSRLGWPVWQLPNKISEVITNGAGGPHGGLAPKFN